MNRRNHQVRSSHKEDMVSMQGTQSGEGQGYDA